VRNLLTEGIFSLAQQPDVVSPVPWKITVEIAAIRACNSDDAEEVDKGGLDGRPPYSQALRPGFSIGRRESDTSGSIAAFFEATANGKPTKVLLTNHHVAIEDRSPAPFPPRWDPASADLLSPSPEDLRAAQKDVHRTIFMYKEQIIRIEENIQKIESDDSERANKARQKYAGQLADARAAMATYQEALPTLAEDNAEEWDAASLAQSSGWRCDQNGVQMDWAVATLTNDLSSPSNRVSLWTLSKWKWLMFNNSFRRGISPGSTSPKQTPFAILSTFFPNPSQALAAYI
jgi:hypothetical protein